ncbi:phosphotransferase [Kribbella sp. NPDC051620]|uniref:phosphotransferase n=1 Tax=Kribbella sp. NPDC051620 TaxID=3364120 RepID=UPI003788AF7D
MNFAPKPDWQPLTSGTGQSNGGVWLTAEGWVVKRLVPGVPDPRHHAYWERQALVAESGIVARTPGLCSPKYQRVMRDADGITLLSEYVESAPIDATNLALALARFAKAPLEEPPWGARDVLRNRLQTVEARGGWTSLPELEELEEPLRQALGALWVRRSAALDELDALPRTPAHGDVHPLNLRGRRGHHVIAFDWEQFGFAPAGFDLGYLAIAVALPLDEELFDDLLLAADADSAARRGAVLTAALTAASRAAWSLDQPSPGDHVDRLVALTPLITEAVG